MDVSPCRSSRRGRSIDRTSATGTIVVSCLTLSSEGGGDGRRPLQDGGEVPPPLVSLERWQRGGVYIIHGCKE